MTIVKKVGDLEGSFLDSDCISKLETTMFLRNKGASNKSDTESICSSQLIGLLSEVEKQYERMQIANTQFAKEFVNEVNHFKLLEKQRFQSLMVKLLDKKVFNVPNSLKRSENSMAKIMSKKAAFHLPASSISRN